MHDVENWPDDVTVAEPAARVVVGGREQKVVDYSITKSLGDSLSGRDGLVATTGDVTIVDQSQTVTQRRVTPWSPLAVRRGETVNVQAGYDTALAPQLVGVVDGTAGGATKNTQLELVDRYERLQIEVTKDPLMRSMPPAYDGGPFRHIGVTPTYVTSTLLRDCGFYATPRHRQGAAVNVPMNGSMWPEYGTVQECSRIGDANNIPVFEPAWWGQAVKNVTATITPSPYDHTGRPFEIMMLVGEAGTSGSVTVAAYFNDQYVRVRITPSKAVSFDVNTGSGVSTVVSLSSTQMQGATMISARVVGGTWTLTADNGVSSTASRSWPWGYHYHRVGVTVPADAAQIGGLMVGYMDTPQTSFTPNARLTPAAYPWSLDAMPALVRRKVADLLREQAEAELAAFWIDDTGVLVWKNRHALVSGPSVRNITSTRDLLDLNWREPSSTTVRSIKVTGKRALMSRATRATITGYEGSKRTIESREVMHEFYGPGTDEDWVMPDLSVEWLDSSAERLGGFHRGRRSWFGATRVTDNGSDNETIEFLLGGSDLWLEKIDPRTFVLEYQAPSITSDQTIETRTPAKQNVWLWEQWKNIDLPIIRAYGKIQWVDQAEHRTGEPGGLQEHVHDVGWWVQHRNTGLPGVADALEQRLLKPQPVLDDVPIIPDARLELGDIITLRDQHVTGLDLRCLIEGIKLSGSEGVQDQTLTLRILAVNGVEATYEELERIWDDSSYINFESEWSGETYTDFENNPLRKG